MEQNLSERYKNKYEWSIVKRSNKHVIGFSGEVRRENETEAIFEVINMTISKEDIKICISKLRKPQDRKIQRRTNIPGTPK